MWPRKGVLKLLIPFLREFHIYNDVMIGKLLLVAFIFMIDMLLLVVRA